MTKVNFVLSAVCAWLLPPLGVFWRFGLGTEFVIATALTICGYVPGVIYAACIIGCD
nr:multiple fission protein 1 [Crypthecodinium cohnii]